MEPTIKLSVALAVYNEQANIKTVLDSVKDIADEIIVVDGTSTDGTAAIAASLGAKVITEPNKTNFHINKKIAIDACQGEWILQLDADERVSTMLGKEIRALVTGDQTHVQDAYYLKRRNYFLGRWLNKGGVYPDPVIRLFRRGKFQLPTENVHELVKPPSAGWMKEDLIHVADPTFSRYLLRSNRYTTLQAQDWLKSGKIKTDGMTALAYFTVKPLYRFLEIYIRHKGFQDGFPGFVFAVYSGLHITSSYVKYWEKSKTGAKIDIDQDWN